MKVNNILVTYVIVYIGDYMSKMKIFIIKTIIVVILFFITIITIRNDNIGEWLKINVFTNNISFSKIKNLYKRYFGTIIPFDKYMNTIPVFSEKLEYIGIEDYKDGIKLKVDNNYLLPAINSGIVTFIGDKDDYNNIIIVEGDETIWYSNVKSNVKLYDEIKKGQFLGEVNGEYLYLVFKKEGKTIDYKEYL